jgi:hypothetical protein
MRLPASPAREAIIEYLVANRVNLTELPRNERTEVCRRWLKHFAARVKRQEGSWIYRGYKWHGFSYGIEPCRSGGAAWDAYRDTKGKFYLFDEGENYGYLCQTLLPFRPDLSQVRSDSYLTAVTFAWTMVFTHEQPEIGPFFAEADPRAIGSQVRRPEAK